MATRTQADANTMLEDCDECERETPHHVSVQILTESAKRENSQFSREPYRVRVCQLCDREEQTRMNNA